MDDFHCIVCGKKLGWKNYACVWAESGNATVVGFAHMKCTKNMRDITEEVMDDKAE